MTRVLQLPAVMLVAHYSGASAKCKKKSHFKVDDCALLLDILIHNVKKRKLIFRSGVPR